MLTSVPGGAIGQLHASTILSTWKEFNDASNKRLGETYSRYERLKEETNISILLGFEP
jgi:hypothetical protein